MNELDELRRRHVPDGRRLLTLGQAVEDAAAGATVEVPSATFFAPVVIERSMTVRGSAEGRRPILFGEPGQPALIVAGARAEVVLERIAIVGGGGELGAIEVRGDMANVTLRDCLVIDAAGLSTSSGTVTLERCVFLGNRKAAGGALAILGIARLRAVACLFVANEAVDGGGALWVEDGAEASLVNCTLVDNRASDRSAGAAVHLTGTTTRQARATLANTVVASRQQGSSTFGKAGPRSGRCKALAAILPAEARDHALLEADRATIFGAASFAQDDFPYRLARSQAGWDDGDGTAFGAPEQALDLFGQSLATTGTASVRVEEGPSRLLAEAIAALGPERAAQLFPGTSPVSGRPRGVRVCRGAVAP